MSLRFEPGQFLCRNGDTNEELVSLDGLHLSKLGTERLIGNLKLTMACCRIGRTSQPGGEPQRSQPRATPHGGATSRGAHGPPAQKPATANPTRHERHFRNKPPSLPRYRRSDQRNSFIPSDTPSDPKINNSQIKYCMFCGESNHRNHVCRFGMPVTCFRCHREGHKEKFCEYYR